MKRLIRRELQRAGLSQRLETSKDAETETPANKTYSSDVTLVSPGCLCPGETKVDVYPYKANTV